MSAALGGGAVAAVLAWRVLSGPRAGAAAGVAALIATLGLAELGATFALAPTPPDAHTPNAWRVDGLGLDEARPFPVPSSLLAISGRTPTRAASPRALVLGDSFAAGEGVQPGEDIGARLAEAWPGVEVLNHGMSGLGFHEEVALWNDHSRRYAPDVVVWIYVLNDLPSSGPSGVVARAGYAGPIDDRIVDRSGALEGPTGSALFDGALRAWRGRQVGAVVEAAYRQGHDPEVSGEALDRMQAELRGVVDSREGLATVFVIWPLLHRLEDYPFRDAHRELGRRAEAAGAVVVDLLTDFEGTDARTWWASQTDHHPNAAAQARAAAAVAAAWQPQRQAAGVPSASRPSSNLKEVWAQVGAAPLDPAGALAVARLRVSAGADDAPNPFDARRVAAVSLFEAVALATGRPEEATVRREVQTELVRLARSSRDAP